MLEQIEIDKYLKKIKGQLYAQSYVITYLGTLYEYLSRICLPELKTNVLKGLICLLY